jgi:hypothetical protein
LGGGRILAETNTVKNTATRVLVKPAAVFGLGFSLFAFVILFIGLSCLMDIQGPERIPDKNLGFGREN